MPEKILQRTSFYKTLPAAISRWRYAKVPLNNASTSSVTAYPTSTTLMEWKIPSLTVCNISRSFVQYQYTIPGVAQTYACVFEGACDLAQTVNFSDGSGLSIVNLENADAYVNVVRPINTTFPEFQSLDKLSGLNPCNQLASTNYLPYSLDGLAFVENPPAGSMNQPSVNYLEQQYLSIQSTQGASLNVNRQFPLSAFKDTFLGIDKNFVSAKDVYLRIYTNYLTRMYGYNNSATVFSNTSWTAPTGSLTLQNVVLFLAIEENLTVRENLFHLLAHGGLRYSIPYVYPFRSSSTAGNSVFNGQYTITNSLGRNLKRVLWAPFDANQFLNGAFDHSNVNGTKVKNYQFFLDSRPLTDELINAFNPNNLVINPNAYTINQLNTFGADYRESQKYLRGSTIQSYTVFQTNWSAVQQFGVVEHLDNASTENLPPSNIDDGIPLNQGDHIFTIQANLNTTVGAYTSGFIHYIWFFFQRSLAFTTNGIELYG